MQSGFVYSESLTKNILREDHILRPMRLRLVYELLSKYNAFSQENSSLIEPRIASVNELMSFHSRDYIEAVGAFSQGEDLDRQNRYGFSDSGDNTISPGMYESAALAVGASIVGAEKLLDSSYNHVFNAGGGYHHAGPDFASGFCIFNDAVIAIKKFLLAGVKRIAYIDIDAHHGDGVQNAFYSSKKVLTISIHQSGETLFPGTGIIDEIGEDEGAGFAVNLPLNPNTNDNVYLSAFNALVPPIIDEFKPEILVTQLGIDTHFQDPLSQLSLTTQGHNSVVEKLKELAPNKWLALGGGGYDLSAVARTWALDYATLSSQKIDNTTPTLFNEAYGINKLLDQVPEIDGDEENLNFIISQTDKLIENAMPYIRALRNQ